MICPADAELPFLEVGPSESDAVADGPSVTVKGIAGWRGQVPSPERRPKTTMAARRFEPCRVRGSALWIAFVVEGMPS